MPGQRASISGAQRVHARGADRRDVPGGSSALAPVRTAARSSLDARRRPIGYAASARSEGRGSMGPRAQACAGSGGSA